MKRFIFFIIVLSFVSNVFAWNKAINYQGKDAKSYIGKVLHVAPLEDISGISDYEAANHYVAYIGFMHSGFSTSDTQFNVFNHYHYDDKFEWKNIGTDPKYLTGKSFKVTNVQLMKDCHDSWLFTLVNINNRNDVCKFVYDSSLEFINNLMQFPFYTDDYLNYLKKNYVNNTVVISTHTAMSNNERTCFQHRYFDTDYKTGEHIKYNDDYETFTVKSIKYHDKTGELGFIMTNKNHTVFCSAGLLYEKSPIGRHASSKVFTMSEWNNLVNMYGIEHMRAIMRSEIIIGMTVSEMELSKGTPTNIDDNDYMYAEHNGKFSHNIVEDGQVIKHRTNNMGWDAFTCVCGWIWFIIKSIFQLAWWCVKTFFKIFI